MAWQLGQVARQAVALFSSEEDAEAFLSAQLASKRAQLVAERDGALGQLKAVCARLGLDPEQLPPAAASSASPAAASSRNSSRRSSRIRGNATPPGRSLTCTVKALHQTLERLQSTLAARSKSVQLALTKLRAALNDIGQTTPDRVLRQRDCLTAEFENEIENLIQRAQAERIQRAQAAEQKRRSICALLRLLGVPRTARTQFDELVLVGDFESLGLGDSSMQMLDARLGELDREKGRRSELAEDLRQRADAVRSLLRQVNQRRDSPHSKLLTVPPAEANSSTLTDSALEDLKRNVAELEALKESLLPAVTLDALKSLARTAANAALDKNRIATILNSLELGDGRRELSDVLDDVLAWDDAATQKGGGGAGGGNAVSSNPSRHQTFASSSSSSCPPSSSTTAGAASAADRASGDSSSHRSNQEDLLKRITSSHWPVERILTCCRDEERILSPRASETRAILDRLEVLDKLRASKAEHDKLEKDPGRFKIPRYAIKAEAFRKKYATLPSRIAALTQSVQAWQTKHNDTLVIAGIDIGHHLSVWGNDHTRQLRAMREARRNRLYEKRRVPAASGARVAPRKKRAVKDASARAGERTRTRAQAKRASAEAIAGYTGASALAFAAKAIPRLLAGRPDGAS